MVIYLPPGCVFTSCIRVVMDPGAANGAATRPADPPPPAQVSTVEAKVADHKPEAPAPATTVTVKAPQPSPGVDVTKMEKVGSAANGKQEHDDNDDVVVQPSSVAVKQNGSVNGKASVSTAATPTPPKPQQDVPADTPKDKGVQDKPSDKADAASKAEEPCGKDAKKDEEQTGAKAKTQGAGPAISIVIDGRAANGDQHPVDDDRGSDPGGDGSSVDGSTDDRGVTPTQGEKGASSREDSTRESSATVEARGAEEGHDSGVDESTQAKENGQSRSPSKGSRGSPRKRMPRSSDPSPMKQRSTQSAASAERKLPMNKVEVGKTASPNLKAVKSKIGSMDNATYKPGGGKIKIESKKLDFSKASSKIAAKNITYTPGGGDKKIESQKLKWNVSSKIGSLDNKDHKPGGGDKKIESQKIAIKAQSKVGSRDNLKHKPGGGDIQKKSAKSEGKSPSPGLMSPATQEDEEVEQAGASQDVTPAH